MADKRLKYPFFDGIKDLPKDKDHQLRDIRKWLETQPQIPKLNDDFLHMFLHCNYYNLDETKSNITAYFSLRSTSPEIFADRLLSDPKVRTAFKNQYFALAPGTTPEGYRVIYLALNDKKVQNFDHVYCAKAIFMFMEVIISECGLCPGYIIVNDAKGLTLSIFLKLNYSVIMKLTNFFQDAAPVRVKKIIFVSSVSFIDKLYAIFRPFMKQALIDKLQFYATGCDLTNFYKTVPKDCVFKDYGGDAGPLEDGHENFMNLLETKYSQWIEDDSVYTVKQPKKEPPKRGFFSFW